MGTPASIGGVLPSTVSPPSRLPLLAPPLLPPLALLPLLPPLPPLPLPVELLLPPPLEVPPLLPLPAPTSIPESAFPDDVASVPHAVTNAAAHSAAKSKVCRRIEPSAHARASANMRDSRACVQLQGRSLYNRAMLGEAEREAGTREEREAVVATSCVGWLVLDSVSAGMRGG